MNFLIELACQIANLTTASVCPSDLATVGKQLEAFPHPVWNSALYPQGRTHFYWVDDNTILFRASSGPKPSSWADSRPRESHLYLWRLGEAPRPHGADPAAASAGYCGSGGVIRYRQERTDPASGKRIAYFLKGEPGQESEQPPRVSMGREDLESQPQGDWNLIERGSCEPYYDLSMRDRTWVIDPDRQYRLDFGPKRRRHEDDHPVTLIRADGDRVELPIKSNQVKAYCTHFHRFDGAFLVWDCLGAGANDQSREQWRQTNCWEVWRVEPPDGRTEKICIPHGAWATFTIKLVPTKIGLLFKAPNAPTKYHRDPGPNGLYRLRNGTAERMLAGLMDDPVVSPSGCKVALSYSPNRFATLAGTPDSPSIIAIDVCASK
jgi:hypothetical protein